MENFSVSATGAQISFSGTAASAALPTVGGSVPKLCRLVATAPCYVRWGAGAQTAVAGDMMIQPADSATIKTAGCANISALQVSGPGVLVVTPLDNDP